MFVPPQSPPPRPNPNQGSPTLADDTPPGDGCALQRFQTLYCNAEGAITPVSLWALLIDGQDAEDFQFAIDYMNGGIMPPPPPGAQNWVHALARHGNDRLLSAENDDAGRQMIPVAKRWQDLMPHIPAELYDDLLLTAARANNAASAQGLIQLGANPVRVLARAAQARDEAAVNLLVSLGADMDAARRSALESGVHVAARRLTSAPEGGFLNHFVARCSRATPPKLRDDSLWSVIIDGQDRAAFRVACGLMSAALLPPPRQGHRDWLQQLARHGTEPPPGPDSMSLADRFNELKSFGIELDVDALLQSAAAQANMASARALIACGANPTIALYRLAQTPDHAGMACLITQNADPEAAFAMAKRAGHGTAMQALLLITPDDDGMARLRAHYLDTGTALRSRKLHRQADLIAAAREGNLASIRQLHPDGQELSAALFSASRTQGASRPSFLNLPAEPLLNHRKAVFNRARETLLLAGANPSDALWLAVKHRDTAATRTLLALGASKEDSVATAIAHQDLETARTLAWQGADISGIVDAAETRLDERLLNGLLAAGLARHVD